MGVEEVESEKHSRPIGICQRRDPEEIKPRERPPARQTTVQSSWLLWRGNGNTSERRTDWISTLQGTSVGNHLHVYGHDRSLRVTIWRTSVLQVVGIRHYTWRSVNHNWWREFVGLLVANLLSPRALNATRTVGPSSSAKIIYLVAAAVRNASQLPGYRFRICIGDDGSVRNRTSPRLQRRRP